MNRLLFVNVIFSGTVGVATKEKISGKKSLKPLFLISTPHGDILLSIINKQVTFPVAIWHAHCVSTPLRRCRKAAARFITRDQISPTWFGQRGEV